MRLTTFTRIVFAATLLPIATTPAAQPNERNTLP
jgi:hypothetical protein